MIYLDTNIFVYATINNGSIGESCRNVLKRVGGKNIDACTSFLTWDEFVFVLRKHRGKDIAVVEGEKFLHFPHLRFIKTDEVVTSQAQEIVKKYGLKPRDAIHAASAISAGCKEIISDDSDFDTVKGLRRVSF